MTRWLKENGLALAAASAGTVYLWFVIHKAALFGSPQTGWVYPYTAPFSPDPLYAGALIAMGAAWLAKIFAGPKSDQTVLTPLSFFLFSVLASWTLGTLRAFTMSEIFQSATANSFQHAAATLSYKSILHDFANFHLLFPGERHVYTNMAGKTFFMKLLLNAGPLWLTKSGMLAVAAASAGVIPLYYAAKKMFSYESAVFACALYCVIPAAAYFSPLLNCVTSTVFLLSLCLLVYAVYGARGAYFAAALYGASLYAQLFFDPVTLAPLGLLSLAIPAAHEKTGLKRFLLLALCALAGFAAAYAAMVYGAGYSALENYKVVVAINNHWLSTARIDRMAWLARNPLEALAGMGVALMTVFFAVQGEAVYRAFKTGLKSSAQILLPGLALCGAWAVMAVMGVAGAEAVRVWQFSAGGVILLAAGRFAETPAPLYTAIFLCAMQAATVVGMVGFVVP